MLDAKIDVLLNVQLLSNHITYKCTFVKAVLFCEDKLIFIYIYIINIYLLANGNSITKLRV